MIRKLRIVLASLICHNSPGITVVEDASIQIPAHFDGVQTAGLIAMDPLARLIQMLFVIICLFPVTPPPPPTVM